MLTRALFAAVLIFGTATVCWAQDTTVVALGIADHAVTEEELESGTVLSTPKFNTAGVAYAYVAHAQKGDTIEVHLTKDGESLMNNVRELDADAPGVLVMAGKTGVPAGGWPDGGYTARVKIVRGGETIAERESDPVPIE